MKAVNAFAYDGDGHEVEIPIHPHNAGQFPRSPPGLLPLLASAVGQDHTVHSLNSDGHMVPAYNTHFI